MDTQEPIARQRRDEWDRHWALTRRRMATLLQIARTMAEQDMGFLDATDAGKFHKAVRLIEEIAANKKLTEEHCQ